MLNICISSTYDVYCFKDSNFQLITVLLKLIAPKQPAWQFISSSRQWGTIVLNQLSIQDVSVSHPITCRRRQTSCFAAEIYRRRWRNERRM